MENWRSRAAVVVASSKRARSNANILLAPGRVVVLMPAGKRMMQQRRSACKSRGRCPDHRGGVSASVSAGGRDGRAVVNL